MGFFWFHERSVNRSFLRMFYMLYNGVWLLAIWFVFGCWRLRYRRWIQSKVCQVVRPQHVSCLVKSRSRASFASFHVDVTGARRLALKTNIRVVSYMIKYECALLLHDVGFGLSDRAQKPFSDSMWQYGSPSHVQQVVKSAVIRFIQTHVMPDPCSFPRWFSPLVRSSPSNQPEPKPPYKGPEWGKIPVP